MTSYAIQWDGKTVTLPPAGPINPEGVSWAWIRAEYGKGIYDRCLVDFADAAFVAQAKRVGSISVDLVLIPRPDNPFDSDAVSIALALYRRHPCTRPNPACHWPCAPWARRRPVSHVTQGLRQPSLGVCGPPIA